MILEPGVTMPPSPASQLLASDLLPVGTADQLDAPRLALTFEHREYDHAASHGGATVSTHQDGDCVVIELIGEIGLAVVAPWDDRALGLTAGRRLVVDASAVTFLDVVGAGLLRRLGRAHPGMALRDPSPAVVRVLELTGDSFLLARG